MNDLYGISRFMWNFSVLSLKLKRSDISYVKFILEGYDGLGIVTTKDRFAAEAIVTCPVSRKQSMVKLLEALVHEGVIKEVHET
ncbi:MAG TPA: DUF4911 domain-containing protein [Deltaproteobacteria bacterium]|nr:DUF4911 domain-containing protein [Deltaproteobacteria bacterium]